MPPSEPPWTHGPRPVGDAPEYWTREPGDPPPTPEEHDAFYGAASAVVDRFLAEHGFEGPETTAYVRGDFFEDRTETLIVATEAFAERPDVVVELLRVFQAFLDHPKWRRWRLVVPLRDVREGGVLAVYPEAVYARRRLEPDELERHVRRLVLRDVAEREGEETVRRLRRARLAPLVRDVLLPFLASGEWVRVLASEPGEPGYELVFVLHRFRVGERLDDLDLEPESGYQDVMPLADDGEFGDDFGDARRERLWVVSWEVPTGPGRRLDVTLGERRAQLFF